MAETTFTWKIENFSKFTADGLVSDTFAMYGHQCLALYLGVANPTSLPSGWSIFANYSLALINQINSSRSVRYAKDHSFCAQSHSRGWPKFCLLSKLHDSKAGFVVNDTCTVKAQITVKPNFQAEVKSEPSHENFATLFDDISKVVGAESSSLVATGEADPGPDAVEVSHYLSLLKHLAPKSFSEIPAGLRAELSSALQVLDRATSFPSHQASAISDFSSEYEELCQSSASNLAVLEATHLFFDSKEGASLSLKRLFESQMKIKSSMDKISRETKHLKKGINGSNPPLLEE